jgi:aminopeptidase N
VARLVAGPWNARTATINGRQISLYVRASRAREVEADTPIAMNARAIAWLETYTARASCLAEIRFRLAPVISMRFANPARWLCEQENILANQSRWQ